jgi:hypothetical protein
MLASSHDEGKCCIYGISLGVAGSDGGGGRLIRVGAFVAILELTYQSLYDLV